MYHRERTALPRPNRIELSLGIADLELMNYRSYLLPQTIPLAYYLLTFSACPQHALYIVYAADNSSFIGCAQIICHDLAHQL